MDKRAALVPHEPAPSKPLEHLAIIHSTLDDAKLSLAAFRVFCHLARRAGVSRVAYPGIRSIVSVCGINKKTAWRALSELEQRGFLRRKGSPGRSNSYTITIPDPKGDPGPKTDHHPTQKETHHPTQKETRKGVPMKGNDRRESNEGGKPPRTDLSAPPHWAYLSDKQRSKLALVAGSEEAAQDFYGRWLARKLQFSDMFKTPDDAFAQASSEIARTSKAAGPKLTKVMNVGTRQPQFVDLKETVNGEPRWKECGNDNYTGLIEVIDYSDCITRNETETERAS